MLNVYIKFQSVVFNIFSCYYKHSYTKIVCNFFLKRQFDLHFVLQVDYLVILLLRYLKKTNYNLNQNLEFYL